MNGIIGRCWCLGGSRFVSWFRYDLKQRYTKLLLHLRSQPVFLGRCLGMLIGSGLSGKLLKTRSKQRLAKVIIQVSALGKPLEYSVRAAEMPPLCPQR